MRFPFGRKKQDPCVLTDTNFLKITWDKQFGNAQNARVQTVIERVDQQLLATGIEDAFILSKTLPYCTFLQAEMLCEGLKDEFLEETEGELQGEFQVQRLGVVHFEEGQLTEEDEVYCAPLVINKEFRSVLISLIEALCNQGAFKAFSYEQKRSYMLDTIYPSYQASLGGSIDELPEFPSQAAVQLKNVRVETLQIEESATTDTPSDSEKEPEEQQETPRQPVANAQEEAVESFFQSVVQPAKSVERVPIKKTNQPLAKPGAIPMATDLGAVHFPQFEVSETNRIVAMHDEQYVAVELNKKMTHYNQIIQEKEQQNNQLAAQVLRHHLAELEQQQTQQNLSTIRGQDQREQLKEKMLSSFKEKQQYQWQERSEVLEAQRDEALELEKKRYQEAIKQIQTTFEQQVSKEKKRLVEKGATEARAAYEEAFYTETGRLQQAFNELQLTSQETRHLEEQRLSEELRFKGKTLGEELFTFYKADCDQVRQQLERLHQESLRVHLLEREEAVKQQENQEVLSQLEKAQVAIETLEKEKRTQTEQLLVAEQRKIDQQNKDLQEKITIFQNMQADMGKKQELLSSGSQGQELASTSLAASTFLTGKQKMIGLFVWLVLGGGFVWGGLSVHQQTQAMGQTIQRQAKTTQQELREQKKAQRTLAAGYSRLQKNQTETNAHYDDQQAILQKKLEELQKKVEESPSNYSFEINGVGTPYPTTQP